VALLIVPRPRRVPHPKLDQDRSALSWTHIASRGARHDPLGGLILAISAPFGTASLRDGDAIQAIVPGAWSGPCPEPWLAST
jgi:hypothetical protein